MVFNSIVFLFAFLPFALFFYYVVPDKFKNGVLLLESLLFYAYANIVFLPLVICLTTINYICGILAGNKSCRKVVRQCILFCCILFNLILLFSFKYWVYISELVNRISVFGLGSLSFFDVFPLGISYYSFKLISYIADVASDKTEPEKNYITFAAYVVMFPQLIVGPIIRYRDMAPYLHNVHRRCTSRHLEEGVQMFVFGLAKKVIIADSVGQIWSGIVGAEGVGLSSASTLLVWLGIIAYSFQLYFDFSGYSEMSNGLSKMLGIDCKANFALPYTSASITEFWKRWHISLSQWFRDYIYIPLGGNRKGTYRQVFNLFLVWLATGIWHGSTSNFTIWGLYYFVLLLLEKFVFLKYLKKSRIWSHIYTLFFVVLGWGIFAAGSSAAPLGSLLKKLLIPQGGVLPYYYLRCYGIILLLSAVCSTGVPGTVWKKIENRKILRLVIFASIFAVSIAFIVGGTNSTALYADF